MNVPRRLRLEGGGDVEGSMFKSEDLSSETLTLVVINEYRYD